MGNIWQGEKDAKYSTMKGGGVFLLRLDWLCEKMDFKVAKNFI
jgi:hypothetical protein